MRKLERVLIADDNRVFRAVLEEIFAGYGARVVSVANGREAYSKLMGESFDLVVLDILMPQMDGFEVLKKVPPRDDLVVFVTTAVYKGRRWEEEARLSHGAAEFMPKPIDPEELRTVLARHFDLPEGV